MNARSVPSEINSSRRIASLGGDTRPQYDTGICNKCRITFRGAKVARRVTCLLLSLVSDIRTHRVQSSENKFIVLRRLSRLVFHIFFFFSFPSRFFFFFFPPLFPFVSGCRPPFAKIRESPVLKDPYSLSERSKSEKETDNGE